MDTTQIALALLTGLIAGGVFRAVQAPIPAPPNAAGVMGIVGLFLGFKLVDWAGVEVEFLHLIGL
jgi:XapX domain-containing protein